LVQPFNRLELTASLMACSALRHSPAGIPILDCQLQHESRVHEAGAERSIKLLLNAKAVGMVAETLVSQPLNKMFRFNGFLAAGKKSTSVVFHIDTFQMV